MQPWMCARTGAVLAVTLALGCAGAGVARADDGVSEVEFKLPDRAAVDTLNTMGADLAENVTPGPDGSVYVEAIVTPDQKAEYAALGYQPIQTVADESTWKQVTDEANAADRAQADAFANLRAGRTVANAGSRSLAATDTVNVGRADYFQNYAGRFISIEAHTSAGGVTANGGYTGPALTAAWLDGSGTTMGSGTLSAFVDDSVYLYHRMLFRVGAVGDGGTMPATVRVASANGGIDTLPVKEWTSTNGTSSPTGFISDFNSNYVDPQQAYQRIRDLAAQYPNLAQIYDLPYKTNGYQRKSQAIVGTVAPYNPNLGSQSSAGTVSNSGTDPDTGKAVVVTSRLYGQDGGNSQSIAIADPQGATNQPLGVSVTGNDITVDPATDATGKITSTSQQVVDAINAGPAASNLVFAEILTSTSTRGSGVATNAGKGVVAPTAKTMLSDFLKAPPSYPRGPQTVQMIRIGAHRDGTKTGVLIYCQEHAREWATPLVCLETAQRLLVNYAHRPGDEEPHRQPRHLHHPDDQRRRRRVLPLRLHDRSGRTCSTTAPAPAARRARPRATCGASTSTATSRWARSSTATTARARLHQRGVRRPGRALRARVAQRAVGAEHVHEHQVRHERALLRRLLHVAPGRLQARRPRELLPYASLGTNQYFEQTARTVLDRIKSYRGTVVLPARTGPVADVLYSAAGNSADEAYYNHGIIGYDFEIGAQRFTPQSGGTSTGNLSAPGLHADLQQRGP